MGTPPYSWRNVANSSAVNTGAAISTRRRTRSGRWLATSTATLDPVCIPMRSTVVSPSASSRSTMAAAKSSTSFGSGGGSDSPNPMVSAASANRSVPIAARKRANMRLEPGLW